MFYNSNRREFTGPAPARTTRYRVIGPKEINGMNVWTIHEILGRTPDGNAILSDPIGPSCVSVEEANSRTRDLVKGKRMLWFNGIEFTR